MSRIAHLPTDELLIVSHNIDRYRAYRAANRIVADPKNPDAPGHPVLEQIIQGIYMHHGADPERLFTAYGVRIANTLFPNAALSYACAYHRAPVHGRVFITGAYQYTRRLFNKSDRWMLVQSIGVVDPNDATLHTPQTFVDGLGKFEMLVDTPELTLLKMMTPTKSYAEKHLPQSDMSALIHSAERRHGGSARKLTKALQSVAERSGYKAECNRLLAII